MHVFLKVAAIVCKIFAAIEWLALGYFFIGLSLRKMLATEFPREAPSDWGTPAYYYRTCFSILVIFILTLLAVAPNRWLVRSRVIFLMSLLVAFLPACLFVASIVRGAGYYPFDSVRNLLNPVRLGMTIIICVPLPLSLILSFYRRRDKGEILYA